MKAVGHRHALPLSAPEALLDLELPEPVPGPHDLLVRVRAVSVNPVDTKMRGGSAPPPEQARVLGWDAVGVVEATGPEVRRFRPGDRVFYAGAIQRPGCHSERHLVDERIAALAPVSLGDADAAALPLTAITAWELLFDRLRVSPGGGAGQRLLVVGGAGGVGSMLIQLARAMTALEVVATASRPESRDWCLALGAHAVVDHREPLDQALARTGRAPVDLVAALTGTERHFPALVEVLRPQGALACIDDPGALDIRAMKRKSLSFHWELMFTRPLFDTPDLARQGALLSEVAALTDAGRLRSTRQRHFGRIGAAQVREAHAWLESGRAIGKGVLEGF